MAGGGTTMCLVVVFTILSAAAGSLTLRLLAESHLKRRIGMSQAQAHRCDDEGNQEEIKTNNQYMFHARRTRLTGKCAQGSLLVSVPSNRSEGWRLRISS
jgi:hypothetical protein